MPDLDTGHIFLTTLAPIKDGTCLDDGYRLSWRQKVRNALVTLPVAQQSPATVNSGLNSPFARNRRTHLARMFVLDDVVYNGREPTNAVAGALKGLATGNDAESNPALPQHTDYLNCAYLVFCADIDAVTETGIALPTTLSKADQERVRRSYAEELWTTMGEELKAIYSACVGFEKVRDAKGFADYLEACHVETTMPFHDYYIGDITGAFHRLPVKALGAAVVVPLIVTVLAFLAALFTQWSLWGINPVWIMLVAGALTGLAFWMAVRFAIRNGEKPLPPGPYDDLPSVLKALYVQQRFSDLAIDLQGAPPEDIHTRFGQWLEVNRPADRSGPTQAPGVIRSPKGAI
ncbi:hypothetical protein [Sagittula salina]|uniref:Uncharacterized protein n=1 Tax=Sagittula salina TaxID=2820268 RepID=A0A940MJN1_9RHOB|nr:hypothetical protein [Sagittula salina]MBP0482741.1 hypothetical protein [Sagittula salina]